MIVVWHSGFIWHWQHWSWDEPASWLPVLWNMSAASIPFSLFYLLAAYGAIQTVQVNAVRWRLLSRVVMWSLLTPVVALLIQVPDEAVSYKLLNIAQDLFNIHLQTPLEPLPVLTYMVITMVMLDFAKVELGGRVNQAIEYDELALENDQLQTQLATNPWRQQAATWQQWWDERGAMQETALEQSNLSLQAVTAERDKLQALVADGEVLGNVRLTSMNTVLANNNERLAVDNSQLQAALEAQVDANQQLQARIAELEQAVAEMQSGRQRKQLAVVSPVATASSGATLNQAQQNVIITLRKYGALTPKEIAYYINSEGLPLTNRQKNGFTDGYVRQILTQYLRPARLVNQNGDDTWSSRA